MKPDGQLPTRFLAISFCLFAYAPCHAWHQTLTFHQRLSYENDVENLALLSEMKFFMWYQEYAIYGAREKLILLKPNLTTSSVELFSFDWQIDATTMEECLQEWSTQEKCYNDVVHVRILPNSTHMDVFATYAHRPMIRSFDLRSLSFTNGDNPIRDPHPPMDSDHSYVMLTFNSSIVTAGYQGDYIPTIRATQGKTLLYALRQNAYFIDGFQYDGKAVFGVVEPSDRLETARVSRLVMTCANRAEIIRKATLNCSTDMFDPSRSFVFHILTALVDPIRTANGSFLLFATFTTDNSSITASAVCLFMLDRQFYDVFTGPSKKSSRPNELHELISNCSPSIPSTIDRDTVESERQFLPYLSNPLLIETLSEHRYTAMNVLQYQPELFCLIIGTSHGRLLTVFMDAQLRTKAIFEELTLPVNMQHPIKSIAYQKVENHSYVILITNRMGYATVKLTECHNDVTKLCLQCWGQNCSIREITPMKHISTMDKPPCPSVETETPWSTANQSDAMVWDIHNRSSPFEWSIVHRSSDEQSTRKLLFFIVIPMSLIVFILAVCIIVLLSKSNCRGRKHWFSPHYYRKTRDCSSVPGFSHTYTNNVLYRAHRNRLFLDKRNQQHIYPIQSELCIRRIASNPVYSTASSQSLPSVALSSSPSMMTSSKTQTLSVNRFCRSYV